MTTKTAAPARLTGLGLVPARFLSTGLGVFLTWAATRIVIAVVTLLFARHVFNDVAYYWYQLRQLEGSGLGVSMREYPTPLVGLLTLPDLLTGGNKEAFKVVFVAAMVVLDLIVVRMLWVAGGRGPSAGLEAWILFTAGLGTVIYGRFDMVPTVLVVVALIVLWSRPMWAGIAVAVGAAIKLWPAALFGVLLGALRPRRGRGEERSWRPAGLLTGGFAGTAVLAVVISLLVGGWTRLLSPLSWQSDRGLQLESVWGTPLAVLRLFDPGGWTVQMSKYQAFEFFGPGIDGLLTASTIATVLGIGVIVGLIVLTLLAASVDRWTVALVVLSVTLVVIVVNKTFSPQYLLWIAAPLGVMLSQQVDGRRRRVSRRLGVIAVVTAILTQLVYPLGYAAIVGAETAQGWRLLVTLLLVARNLLVVLLACWTVWLSWTSLRPAAVTAPASPPA